MKDYYSILGVPFDAQIDLIRSVYRSLSQIYHPDKYAGDKKYAEDKMKEINEAYACLKDSKKRKDYDEQYKKEFNKSGSSDFKKADNKEENNFKATIKEDWDLIIDYYEEIEDERKHLYKIDKRIAMAFQIAILGYKSSNNWKEVSKIVVDDFFTRYFGSNTQIHRFVELILLEKKTKIANEVNRAVKVLGDKDPDTIINKIEDKYEDELEFVEDNTIENWYTFFEDYEYRNYEELDEFYEWLHEEDIRENIHNEKKELIENSTPGFWKAVMGIIIVIVLLGLLNA